MRFPFSLTHSQGRTDKREWTCRNRGLLLTSFSFIKECKAANKQLCVWTVNKPDWMLEVSHESMLQSRILTGPPQAVKWEVDAILTDRTQEWLDLRSALTDNYAGTMARQNRSFFWTVPRFWLPVYLGRRWLAVGYMEMIGGPFDPSQPTHSPLAKMVRAAKFAYGMFMIKVFPP
jgi:hypothetical protein